MNPQLEQRLCEKYPDIFANRHKSIQESPMAFGFECGDGWYDIIDTMCELIKFHVEHQNQQNKRNIEYNEIFTQGPEALKEYILKTYSSNDRIEKDLARALHDGPRAVPQAITVTADQVKQKYGTLRFYYTGGNDMISGIVSMAEAMSGKVCEECGAPGITKGKRWVYTTCDLHSKEGA